MQKLMVNNLSQNQAEISALIVVKINNLVEAYNALALTINNLKFGDELDILRERIKLLEENSILHGDQQVALLATVNSLKKE